MGPITEGVRSQEWGSTTARYVPTQTAPQVITVWKRSGSFRPFDADFKILLYFSFPSEDTIIQRT